MQNVRRHAVRMRYVPNRHPSANWFIAMVPPVSRITRSADDVQTREA
jgi:hypothetical protein